MGDVLVTQNLYAVVAKNPGTVGAPVTERDFAIDPAEQLSFSDYNENEGGRFQVPASGSLTLPFGSVALGKLAYIRVETDCGLQITNSLGTSPTLVLKAARTSVLNIECTGLQLINPGATVIKGRYIVVGD